MPVKHANAIEESVVAGAVGVTRKVLIPLEETPNFYMRSFTIQPGCRMPLHTNLVEHEQYVLRGQARICIGEEEFDVKQGSVVFIPAGVPHWYRNAGSEPFEFLCIVPNLPDETKILE